MTAAPDTAESAAPPTDPEPRLYEAPPVERRFSPGDVLRLLLGLALLLAGVVLATAAEDTISGAESDIVEAFSGLPDRVEEAVVGVAQLIAMLFPLGGALLALWKRKWRLLVSLWLAANVASVTTYPGGAGPRGTRQRGDPR